MLDGKGMWIWQIKNCEGGDLGAIVAKAQAAHLSHVIIKVADGTGYGPSTEPAKYPKLVRRLQDVGIQAWVWQYVYANHPTAEAEWGARLANKVGADGFVIDAEVEYKGKYSRADTYATVLRSHLDDDIPIALSSYYLPSYHPTIPWKQFLAVCDLNMPQIYWCSHSPVWAVQKSIVENRKFGVPVFPTIGGHTRIWHRANTQKLAIAEIAKFGLLGFNVWSWQHMGKARWNYLMSIDDFDDNGIRVVNLPGSDVIECNCRIENGTARVDLRSLLEGLGYDVISDHLADQNKIYVRKQNSDELI